MRILLELALLIALALLASHRRVWVFRRTRSGAALFNGGWLMILIGILIGPRSLGLIRSDHAVAIYPLLLLALSWAGFLVGLQADRRVLRLLPRQVTRLALLDAAFSIVVTTAVALTALSLLLHQPIAALLPYALVFGVCSVSWSPEVYSLRQSDRLGSWQRGTLRGAAGLGSIAMLLLYVLAINFFAARSTDPAFGLTSPTEFALGILAPVFIALAIGTLGPWLTGLTEREESQFVLVLLGILCFAAGAAAMLDDSPLFVAMLAGAVVANLRSNALIKFKRMLIEAEQPIAMLLMLGVGVIADPSVLYTRPLLCALLILSLWAARLFLKLVVARRILQYRGSSTAPTPHLAGLLRPNPLAIAIAAGFAICSLGRSDIASLPGDQILMIIVILGVACEISALAGPYPARVPSDAPSPPEVNA